MHSSRGSSDITRLERAKAEVPGKPERTREGKECEWQRHAKHDRENLDLRPRLIWRAGDHPGNGNPDSKQLASNQIEDVGTQPEVGSLASLERQPAVRALILQLEPPANDAGAAA